ncbi:unnamed protein product [Acanthoscelides obtectus]|uniref:Uncharacterized protein n=1 Tax=Acanthoscelides obtectus TaxID=200917 RepID=A0A9P0M9G9_ACAOB|nr:unnamed protein product [Acanthoscelides obtectus]CAK1627593.1 hypothetical protein AOBTE_LOCUS4691 [Acanthoscelides obtectus]
MIEDDTDPVYVLPKKSETWVTTALKKVVKGGTLEKDMRGRHKPNKIAEDLRDRVRAHIKLFPIVPSHYIR